jgi:hypothetical protein
VKTLAAKRSRRKTKKSFFKKSGNCGSSEGCMEREGILLGKRAFPIDKIEAFLFGWFSIDTGNNPQRKNVLLEIFS